jgi:hypothetical protein
MTSKQARGVPAEVGRSFGPGRLDEPERYCSKKKRPTTSCCQSATRVGMSNPAPVGSPRKSAAIIPSVNETLTGGLPIDPFPPALTFA